MFVALLVLWGGVKAYFSSPQWREKLQQSIVREMPNAEFEFASMDLVLAGGWIPRVALELRDVQIQSAMSCRLYQAHIDQSRFHFSWKRLLDGRVELRPVQLGHVKLQISDMSKEQCFQKARVVREETAKKPTEPASRAEEQAHSAPPAKPTLAPSKQAVGMLFSSLHISELALKYKNQTIFFRKVAGGPLFPDQPWGLEGSMAWSIPEEPENRWPRFQFEGRLAKNLVHFDLNGRWKEGEIRLKADWNKKRKSESGDQLPKNQRESYHASLSVKNIPLAPLTRGLHGMKLWSRPFPYQSAWLSCEMTFHKRPGPSSRPLDVKNCSVEGELGRVQVRDIALAAPPDSMDKFEIRRPFELALRDVAVEKVLKVFQIDMLGGILGDFGRLDAEVRVDEQGRAEWIGAIRDIVVAFSRSGIRGRQFVPQVKGRFSLDGDRISGQLDKVDLRGGQFEGLMSFNFNRRFSEGVAQFSVASIQFDPSIQRLMTDGEMSPIALFGKIWVADNKVSRWEGQVGLDELRNNGFVLRDIKIALKKEVEADVFETSVAQGKVFSSSKLMEFLRPVFAGSDKMPAASDLMWSQLRARVETQGGDAWLWRQGQVRLDPFGYSISTRGRWRKGGELEGKIWRTEQKDKSWIFSGSAEAPKLTPDSQNVKELAKKDQAK